MKKYTRGEEIANSVSHGFGILFGIAAGVILIKASIASKNAWAVAGVTFYLIGMLASYSTSTLYHSTNNVKRKSLLRKLDHSAIYLHIAGTYAPFTLVVLRDAGAWGWSLFTFVWLSAIVGIILSFTNLKEHSNLETICYIVMGCSILIAFKPLTDVLSPEGLMSTVYWLIAGGVSYVVGALFYSLTKLKYMHFVFHLFVLFGSVCHVIAIYSIL
ncbi:PAQR family membrane homeostasis protein TrhA [Coprobacter tertius]|uniref:Hemolysin III family protein n=1 Tax=Coprobacter tertius TaxID=2944915 RepID=A0ABT1MI33_9BACT|nr:hemolysin III family protein [Coprobacter tertius]MCP9612280.1 hemolysin III family protein [Coprobacter tertius]